MFCTTAVAAKSINDKVSLKMLRARPHRRAAGHLLERFRVLGAEVEPHHLARCKPRVPLRLGRIQRHPTPVQQRWIVKAADRRCVPAANAERMARGQLVCTSNAGAVTQSRASVRSFVTMTRREVTSTRMAELEHANFRT
eukprot:6179668-Pleurochrysis_carterae.AAC.2